MERFLQVGREAGFRQVDLRRLRANVREWTREGNGEIRETAGTIHILSVRGFRESGFPVGACLSSPSIKGARNVFRELQRGAMADNAPGFDHLLPTEARRVRLEIHDPVVQDANKLGAETASRLSELMIRYADVELAGWRLRLEERKVNVANTRGFEAKYKKSLFSLHLKLRQGINEVEVVEQRTHWLHIQPDRLLGRGIFFLGAEPGHPLPRKRGIGLVLSPFAAATILHDFAAVLRVSGEFAPGDIRCAPQVQIVDSPLLDGMPGSVPMDDEGVMCRETELVEGGRVQARITDLAGAAREGAAISGNGFRSDADPFPRARFTNLCVRPSVISLERIMKETGRGVLVTGLRLRGAAGAERTYGASGYMFDGSDLGEPVHFGLRTAFLSYFLKIDRVSRESASTVSGGISVLSPYLRVEAERRKDEWVV
ncbi:MAG TPA: hypothetical protein ENN40_05895 [Candidatus Aminicenantes bacterium]|nr:hypothetical protein [Candidatus Aminicenantes bacterium]